jgi:ornithine cyclodeaminase
MTILTALRTARQRDGGEMAGAEGCRSHGADRQWRAGRVPGAGLPAICGIREVRLYDIDPAATAKCARNLAGRD